jgi:LSD1 subclass zinc finger protein
MLSLSQTQTRTTGYLSRSSSGTSKTGSTNGRRGSVVLAQLRAATAAGSSSIIRGAESNDEDDDDRLIDMAINAIMGEPDTTMEQPSSILGVSRNVSGSSVNSRASRASSVRSKEPSHVLERNVSGSTFNSRASRASSVRSTEPNNALLESRFAGVSLKPAPVRSTMETHHVPSSDEGASSFDSINNKNHPVETSEYIVPGGGEGERPGLGERQPSWMRDALEQMSAGDVEAFLNESHATMEDAAMAAIHSASSASPMNENQNHLLVDGFENTEILEQYRIIAHHEARQRVKENLGYDPVERAQEEQLNSKKGSRGNDGGDGKKKSILNEVTLPPMCPPAIIPAAKVGICLPKESLPRSRFLEHTATPRQPELCKGQIVPSSSGSSSNHHGTGLVDDSREIQIVARCLGCRSFLQIPIHATLVHCPQCSTISPATSTR